ncbi:MAG: hydrogenase nickel incorporation protein HypB [Deltaproteobacteria bacterium]|nr:hydrogenase nickel incorporation protein HypB [Deltaproteobacteria bacterium]
MRVAVVKNILDANSRIAQENRKLFDRHGLTVINLMSSPGAGKTTLLEQMGNHFGGRLKIGVVEGDIQTTLDAERVAAAGLEAVQIETDGACHLDANMVQNALGNLDLEALDLLVVENVGNLVCPADFNIGEDHKVMMLSVTEGDDKPYKYPLMFRESRVLLISKVDLLPHLRCNIEKIKAAGRAINPDLVIFEISSYSGQGLDDWHNWVQEQIKAT